MAQRWPDRVLELTTGTGPFPMTAAVPGFQRFSDVDGITVGDTFKGAVIAISGNSVPTGAWLAGLLTYSAANQITVTDVEDSSNGGADVVWGAGRKWVMACPTAADYVDWLASMAGALQASNNLSDLADAEEARTNLGVYSTEQVDAAVASNGTGNRVVTGLGIAYTGTGLVWGMSAGSATIDGTLVTAAAQTVTLSAADATNPRIDTLYVDDTGTFGKITGTPAVNPSTPSVDPTSQLYLGYALVPATATDLTAGITTETIYDEGGEWTGSTSGSGITIGSTNNPKTGTKCVEFTAVAANAYAKFVDGSPSAFGGTSSLLISIRSKAAWNAKRSLNLQYHDASGVALGTPAVVKEGSFGFSSSNTSAYQDFVIPDTLFAVAAGAVRGELRCTVKGTGGTMGFYLDVIKVQTITSGSGGTGGGGVSSGITQDQADARYAQRANNLSDLTTPATALTNLGGTAVGVNTFKLANPSAITFLRFNADNSVSALSASAFRTAIGAGTGSGGGDMIAANNLSDVVSASSSRTNLGATTVGANVFTLTNPGAITFLRFNADNSVSALSASAFRTAIGAGVGGGDLVSTNNLSDLANAGTARTNLGGTTAGASLFTLANPSAITFLRVNADNSVSALSASAFRTAIGAGTGSGDMLAANNLSDVVSASTARTNLGLGTLATQSGTFSGTSSGTNTGDQTITLTGNVTGSGTGSFAATIANSAVTLAKIANASANSKLLGSGASGSGAAYTELTLGSGLVMSGTTLSAAGGGSFRGALAYKSTNQTTANYTTETVLTFDTELYDTDSWHDTSSNTSRFVVPSGVSYVIARSSIGIGTGTFSGTEWVALRVKKNGSAITGIPGQLFVPNTGAPNLNWTSPPIAVTAGDYIELTLQIQTDTSITVNAESSGAVWAAG